MTGERERKEEIRKVNISFGLGIALLVLIVLVACTGKYDIPWLVCLIVAAAITAQGLKWNRESLGFIKERHRVEDDIARLTGRINESSGS